MRWIVVAVVFLWMSSVNAQECLAGCGIGESIIRSNPRPSLYQLIGERSSINTANWYRVRGPVSVLDKPEGIPVTSHPAGDFFASVQSIENGWAQINDNEWVPASHLEAAPLSSLGGIMLEQPYNPPHPVGWMRTTLLTSSEPGAAVTAQSTPVIQYQQVFTYADVHLGDITWTQVGINQWVDSRFVARIVPIARPADIVSKRWVSVDLNQQVLIAYEGDQPVFASLVSTGLRVTPTIPGVYTPRVRFRYDDMTMVDDSPFYYYMEDVPYVWYFNGDHALHGAYWHDHFGFRRSHGCVNLPLVSAAWVYRFMSEDINWNTSPVTFPQIHVHGDNDWDVPLPPRVTNVVSGG